MNEQHAPTQTEIRAGAQRLYWEGLSVVKVAGNGTKRPLGRWEAAQTVRTPGAELDKLFPEGSAPAQYGVGVVCGAVSDGLLMVEVEGAAVREGWIERADYAMQAAGLMEAWAALLSGWAEYTPSGGVHFHLRVVGGECPGNLKLAQRAMLPEEFDARQRELFAADNTRTWPKTMWETRGEGGFAVRAPSGGPVHPSGRSYRLLRGGPETVPNMGVRLVDALLAVLRSLNTYNPPQRVSGPITGAPKVERTEADGLSPADDFNERASWGEILDGVLDYSETRPDGVELWTRLGKDFKDGHSATIGHAGADLLRVFSSSVEGLPTDRSLNKFQCYTILRFGTLAGDAYSKAAKELVRAGYGSPAVREEPSEGVDTVDMWEGLDAPAVTRRPAGHGDTASAWAEVMLTTPADFVEAEQLAVEDVPELSPVEAAPVVDVPAEIVARGVALIAEAKPEFAWMSFRAALRAVKGAGGTGCPEELREAATAAGVDAQTVDGLVGKVFG